MADTPAPIAATKPSVRPIWIIAFAGHRSRPGDPSRSPEAIEGCRDSLQEAFEALMAQAGKAGGTVELHCGVAEGADLLAIGVAKDLGLPVHIILPMPLAAFEDDFEAAAWKTAEAHVRHAADVISPWTLRIADGDNARPGCYHDASLQMLEAADVLVAICTRAAMDDPEPEPGGTGEAVAVAGRLGLPRIVLDPARKGEAIQRDAWEPSGAAEERLATLDRELPAAPAPERATAQDVHDGLDRAANAIARGFRWTLLVSILLHFTATLLAAINAAFAKFFAGAHGPLHAAPVVLTAVELALVLAATVVLWWARRRHANPRWRRTRFAAEIARGIVATAGIVDPLRPLVTRHDDAWKRFALALSLSAHRERMDELGDDPDRLEASKGAYLAGRIEDQRAYFKKHQRRAARRLGRWGLLSTIASTLAIPVIAAALVLKVTYTGAGKDPWTALLVLLGPILLPLLAGLAGSLIVAGDAARRASRYRAVEVRLARAAHLLPAVRTESSLRRLVLETEDILLDETIEWHAAAEGTGH